jgi:membrane-associated phospholipid phosphatase
MPAQGFFVLYPEKVVKGGLEGRGIELHSLYCLDSSAPVLWFKEQIRMEALNAWGLEFVRATQITMGKAFLLPMQAITLLGSELFALAALPLIYWCVDRKKGARIGILILISAFANLWVKTLFKLPRPYELDPSLELAREHTSAFPSGHSQTSMTFWGVALTVLPKGIGLAAIIAIPLLVGLSRIYLGVHFPIDVLAGWALGGFFVVLFYALGQKIEAMLHNLESRFRVIIVAAVALAMNFLMPEDTMLGGAFLGSGLGFVLVSKSLRFEAKGGFAEKALRYALGMAGAVIIYLGPKYFLGDSFPAQASLIRFLRYGLLGFWVSYGAPLAFYKLNLIRLEIAG